MTLLEVIEEANPVSLSNGQIRMQCPFRDRHPDGRGSDSMFITPDINAYHCFSCGAHGRLTTLLSRKFDIGYFTALEIVKLTPFERVEKKKTGFEVDEMWEVKPSRIFTNKGYPDEVQSHFKIGVTKSKITIIPFYWMGELVGIQERQIKRGKRVVKNSEGFDKKHYVYNYDPTQEETTLVEGYSDVFRLHMFDEHAESTLGSSITEEQADLLSVHKRIYIAGDNDDAGIKFNLKAYYRLEPHVEELLFIPYQDKDPGECTSRRKWKRYKREAATFSEYCYEMTMLRDDFEDIKQEIIKSLEK